MRKGIVIVAGLIILALANYSIYSRERLLTEGNLVLLQLAPVDPRSLMQGDYMALRMQAANDLRSRVAKESRKHNLTTRVQTPTAVKCRVMM